MFRTKFWILSLVSVIYISVFVGTVITKKENKQYEIYDNLDGTIVCNKQSYNTLQNALDKNVNSDVIYINDNIEENTILKNKHVIIDGRGHTLTGLKTDVNDAIMEFENCVVTIRNLTIDGQNSISDKMPRLGIFLKSSTIYLNNVKIININHQEYKQDSYPKGYPLYYVNDEDKKQDIYINGCEFSSFDECAIYINNRNSELINIDIGENLIKGQEFKSSKVQTGIIIYGNTSGQIKDNEFINLVNKESCIVYNDKCILQLNDNSYIIEEEVVEKSN